MYKNFVKKRVKEITPLNNMTEKPTVTDIDKQAQIISNILLDSWERSKNTNPKLKIKAKKKIWTEKIIMLKGQIKYWNNTNPGRNDLHSDSEILLNKVKNNQRKEKLKKLMKKQKTNEFKKWANNIESQSAIAKMSKILEKKSTKIGSIEKEDGTFTKSPTESINELLNVHIGKKEEKYNEINDKPRQIRKKDKEKIKIITNKTRILQAIRDTKKKKTPGPDKIIN